MDLVQEKVSKATCNLGLMINLFCLPMWNPFQPILFSLPLYLSSNPSLPPHSPWSLYPFFLYISVSFPRHAWYLPPIFIFCPYLSISRTHTRTPTHTLSLTHSHFLSLSHIHTHTASLTFLFLSFSHSLSLSITHSLTHTHKRAHTHTHTRTHSHTHTFSLSLSLSTSASLGEKDLRGMQNGS